MNKLKIFLINLLLFFIAGFLVILFAGFGLFTAIITIIFQGSSTAYFRNCAVELDIFGNVICKDFFNILLIKKESVHLFGIVGMTVSENLGRNLRVNTLSKTGKFVANFLDFLDPNHCINAIRE